MHSFGSAPPNLLCVLSSFSPAIYYRLCERFPIAPRRYAVVDAVHGLKRHEVAAHTRLARTLALVDRILALNRGHRVVSHVCTRRRRYARCARADGRVMSCAQNPESAPVVGTSLNKYIYMPVPKPNNEIINKIKKHTMYCMYIPKYRFLKLLLGKHNKQ